MAHIYAFQLGNEDLFKIGKTSNSLGQRRNQLQMPVDVDAVPVGVDEDQCGGAGG
ncbi:hypothetical protein ACIA5H_34615 [Nocardia sp. NPDC051900]|uniref:hypothetical protein n=1 Tax=Nocardia sp. NPDC051900 TaxID=3364326 RepID=UPI0037A5E007